MNTGDGSTDTGDGSLADKSAPYGVGVGNAFVRSECGGFGALFRYLLLDNV